LEGFRFEVTFLADTGSLLERSHFEVTFVADDDDDDDNNNNFKIYSLESNTTCSTDCKYRTAATLYTVETGVVSGI
jgi:hypothetical protein